MNFFLGSFLVVAAFLVIVVQPVATGILLSRTGGHPLLWHGTQVVFQLLLCCGYLLGRSVTLRSYVLIALGGVALSTASAVAAASDGSGGSTLGLSSALWQIVGSVGGPFVLLSAMTMLAHRFASRSSVDSSIALYAASNVGSLVALVAYPLWIEPAVDLTVQLRLWWWSAGAVVAVAVGVLMFGDGIAAAPSGGTVSGYRLRPVWIVCGGVPVALSLALTTYLSTAFGSHPIVWLLPFGSFLASLSLSFTTILGSHLEKGARWLAPPLSVLAILNLLGYLTLRNPLMGYVIQASSVCAITVCCHRRLFRSRPLDDSLPFYLSMTIGGLIAALFSVFVAPVILNPALYPSLPASFHKIAFGVLLPEYIALTVLGAVVIAQTRPGRRNWAAGLLFGSILTAAIVSSATLLPGDVASVVAGMFCLIGAWGAGQVLDVRAWPVALAAVYVTGSLATAPLAQLVHHARSSFGQLKVEDRATLRYLTSGNTIHGLQVKECVKGESAPTCSEPLAYYNRAGAFGTTIDFLRTDHHGLRLAVVGLGTGSAAAFCEPGDNLSFIEIDKAVVDIAEAYFGYLTRGRQSCGQISVEIGDGRVALREAPPSGLDLLMLDAFTSDYVPAHLLTKEAFADYAKAVSSEGLIMAHLSQRFFDLVRVVRPAGAAAGLASVWIASPAAASVGAYSSEWVALSQDTNTLERLRTFLVDRGLKTSKVEIIGGNEAWTDQRHSVLSVLKTNRAGSQTSRD